MKKSFLFLPHVSCSVFDLPGIFREPVPNKILSRRKEGTKKKGAGGVVLLQAGSAHYFQVMP